VTAPPSGRILTLNRGSATLKGAIYEASRAPQLQLSLKVDRVDGPGARISVKDAAGKPLMDASPHHHSSDSALEELFDWLGAQGHLKNLSAAGHRLVHGGANFREPVKITPDILAELEQVVPLDPDHLPAALSLMRFVAQRFPEVPQIGCFDTAFHASLPNVARMYALPRRFFDGGVMRFGFHGLSYEYILSEIEKLDGDLAGGRVIMAHLGNGASMAAVRHGKCIDTSMGFTPLEGLVMGTRSGDIDPGVILYLLEQGKMSAAEVNDCLNKASGLLGVSGSSEDMRDLLAKTSLNDHAAEAVELFCYRARKYIGSYAAALGGLDLLVFAGGIGEKAAPVRSKVCQGLDFLGIQLDPQRNQANESVISSASSRVKVRIVETNEDLTIVRHVLAALSRS
jgi:acetate kinase